jgi:hypothetical protein
VVRLYIWLIMEVVMGGEWGQNLVRAKKDGGYENKPGTQTNNTSNQGFESTSCPSFHGLHSYALEITARGCSEMLSIYHTIRRHIP